MFFPLSKILGFFAIPSNLVVSVGILGLLLMPTRFARAGRALAFASLIVLAILGLSPAGNALIIPLEERFPRWDATRGAPDGIIVLGGAISPDVSAARDEVALNEAAERLTMVAELARRYPDARIVFSGGSGALIYDEGAEAAFALRVLESLGIPRARITLEDRSRNTVENAVLSKAIAQPKPGERWLLVTSAHHLPRRSARHRHIAGAGRSCAQRGGRAHDRDRRARAALSASAHRVHWRLRTPRLWRHDHGGGTRGAIVRQLRYRQ